MAVDRSRKNPQLGRDEIKKRLEDALSDVERSGSFLMSDSFKIGVNPGLEVLGAGPIGLPLSTEMAKRIIRHASPYRKGSETPVNESGQKSWELKADQFFLRNPAWTAQIKNLLKAVVPGLGLTVEPTQVRGEVSKLVVHEEGAFLPHQDSEKTDGMFGTLVVSLPSKHEGGDVVASQKGKSRTFSSSPGSDFGFSYAAWYSDITHEVKPVTSGYRIVLTYNLIHRQSAMLLHRESPSTMLIPLLDSWAVLCKEVFPTLADQPVEWLGGDEDACPTGLIYLLDNKYERHGQLSFTQLKGVDQARVAEVRKACEQTGFSVFLVNVGKSETGLVEDDEDSDYSYECCVEPQHHIYHIQESSLTLSEVVEPEDLPFADDVDIDVDDDDIFVQADAFDEPDEEEYSGRHYDEATASHLYRRTGLLIIPPFFRVPFVLYAFGRGSVDASAFLEEAHSAASNRPDDDRAVQNLRQLCKGFAFNGGQNSGFIQQEIYDTIVTISLEVGDEEVLKQCLKLLGNQLSLSAGSNFGKAILSLGFSNVKPILDDIITSNVRAVKKLGLVSNVISAYLSECECRGVEVDSKITQWQDDLLAKIISSCGSLNEADGPSVVEIIKEYPSDGVLKRLMLFLETNVGNSGFIVEFLICLHDASQDTKLGQIDVSGLYKSILSKALEEFKIDALTSSGSSSYGNPFTQPKPGYYGSYNTTVYGLPSIQEEKFEPGSITWRTMMQLLEQCDKIEIDTSKILELFGRRALGLREESVESMYCKFFLPFISSLCSHLKSRASRPTTSTEQGFIVQLLEIYIRRYVKMQPKEPTDWGRTLTISCGCEDCRMLRRYVEDKGSKSWDFRLAERRRKHVSRQLDGTFSKATVKSGTPHILRVEKTNERYKIDLRMWNDRVPVAKSQLATLSKHCPLLEIIGEDSYAKLLQHECLQSSVADSNLAPPSLHLAPRQGPNAASIPKKRSFCDLTDA